MKRLTIVAALLAALVLAATALAATKIAGTYQTKITGTGANTLHGALDGTWTVSLKSGKYAAKLNGNAVVNGKYTVKKSTISLTDTGGSGKCKGTGKFKFTLKHKTLTLKKISDTKACADRDMVLAHPFKKIA
jgi:hypothetical protein